MTERAICSYVSVVLVAFSLDALDEVEEELTGHGLYAAGQRVVVDVLRE